jgi:hypothetical protein
LSGKSASSVLPQSISKRKARSTKQYHNPLAVEPESAKDAAAKLRFRFSSSIKTLPQITKGFHQMFKTLGRVVARGAMLAGALVVSVSAFAQAPTDAQREAIRSACRSDYMAHCSSVPPGGLESLQCLQKNMPSLSGSCKSAVSAVEAPAAAPAAKSETPAAAPKADTPAAAEPAKPAAPAAPTAAPKAAAGGAAKKPTDAQVAAIRSACRSDYPKVCAGVPAGGAPALQCLDKNKAKVSSGCQQALNAAAGAAGPAAASTGGAPAAGSAAAPAAAAPAVIVLRPMRPREELFVLRSACGGDVRSLCGGVAPGGGRIVQCLATNAGSLSPACKDVLSQFRAQ